MCDIICFVVGADNRGEELFRYVGSPAQVGDVLMSDNGERYIVTMREFAFLKKHPDFNPRPRELVSIVIYCKKV